MDRHSIFIIIFIMFFTLPVCFISDSKAGDGAPFLGPETDGGGSYILTSVFDLRDRDSFVQVTNITDLPITIHVQIFAVNDNCRENDFFDDYTGNDTHVYNMSDIMRNDGNPSGVVLNDGEYGMVIVTSIVNGLISDRFNLIGNFRIEDNAGYEYRTNSPGLSVNFGQINTVQPSISTVNFNTEGDVSLSDGFALAVGNVQPGSPEVTADPLDVFGVLDIDIYDLNEVPFSCRNIITACIDEDNPRYEELLEEAASEAPPGASVASFDFGINDAIPSSKGAVLACPNNVISEGFVRANLIGGEPDQVPFFGVGFIGLNNGNGRGSMDSFWQENTIIDANTPG